MKTGEIMPILMVLLIVVMVVVVGVIVFVERGQRRIQVQYARRVVGRKMYGGQSTHLPLKVNTAGVIPPIFASSLLMFPATIASFVQNDWVKWIVGRPSPRAAGSMSLIYVGLIIFFCYFYTAVTFNPVDVADNLKKWGGYVPGLRPGKPTAEYIDRILTRITLGGAIYVSAVCVLPSFLVPEVQRSLLLRRYGPADRGRGGHGHHEPDRVPSAHPPLRGFHEKTHEPGTALT